MSKVTAVFVEAAVAADRLVADHLPGALARAGFGPDCTGVALTVDGIPRYRARDTGRAVVVDSAPSPDSAEYEAFLALPRIELVDNAPDFRRPEVLQVDASSLIGTELRRLLSELWKTDPVTDRQQYEDRPVPEGEPWMPKPVSAVARKRIVEETEVEEVLARHRQALLDGPHLVSLLRDVLAYGDEASAWKAVDMIAPGATLRVVEDKGWTSVEAMEGWKVNTFQLGSGSIPLTHALVVGAISLRHHRLRNKDAS
ncbi:hypothetical protein [Microvirga massiliensis]|uniref:hypothetical protein n=1 Tax=Microvirga massiliensis TaxID=1033741 RepID=UPI00062BE3DE|nr:hypothetical protein [Microvirga massiliensis]